MELKKAVRTAQTYAAPLLEAKAWTQRSLRSTFKMPSEPSYRAFEKFPFEPNLQFLDVGANRGQTLASIRLYNSSVPVLGFEPNLVLSNKLYARYHADQKTTIYPFGLGAETGQFDLFIPHYRGFMFDGLASFDWDSAHDWLNSDRLYGFNERHLKVKKITCEVRKWDDVVTHPALVKIDVQGFEKNVLSGGIQTLREYRPVFLIENDHPRQAHEDILLAERYRRAAYTDGRFVIDQFGVGNTYYLPEENIDRIKAAYLR